jgi:hypothetical protein
MKTFYDFVESQKWIMVSFVIELLNETFFFFNIYNLVSCIQKNIR